MGGALVERGWQAVSRRHRASSRATAALLVVNVVQDRRLPAGRRAAGDRHAAGADSAAVQAQAVTARSYAYIHLTTEPSRITT